MAYSNYPLPSGHSPHEVAVWPPQFTNSPPDPVEKWVHVRMLREINLVHPHVLLVPLLLYFLVLQLIQKWSLNLLCLRCNQIQFHIFDLLQYEGQILLVYIKKMMIMIIMNLLMMIGQHFLQNIA